MRPPGELDRAIPISEIFGPVIQGEGHLAGRPTLFIRTGGCDYRCVWCDTMYAVDPKYRSTWMMRTPQMILAATTALAAPPMLVTISGGNPAIHNLYALIVALRAEGYETALETQGTIAAGWMGLLRHLVVSPKPPSAGQPPLSMVRLASVLASCVGSVLKVVVFDEEDYRFAQRIHETFKLMPFYLSVGTDLGAPRLSILERMAWLMDRAAGDPLMHDAHVLPQLHALAYGGRRGK